MRLAARAAGGPPTEDGDPHLELPKPEELLAEVRPQGEVAVPNHLRVPETSEGLHSPVPKGYDWSNLLARSGDDLETQLRHVLERLAKEKGLLGLIFRKAQNKIQDPAKLERLIKELIDREQWTSLEADVKGDAYEGLLEKNSQDTRGGAGQYFTPRPLIQAMVECVDPKPMEVICDPACGPGGFLLAAFEHVQKVNPHLDRAQKKHLKREAIRGIELVDAVTRLCAMNLLLHGVGPSPGGEGESPVVTDDSLRARGGKEYGVVLTNPPFGKKSSVMVVNKEGEESREALTVLRDDFWATTSNKQLNFVQHIRSILKIGGRAAADNVLFEGGRRGDGPPKAPKPPRPEGDVEPRDAGGSLAAVHVRRARRPRQGQPGRLLAEGR